MRLFSICGNPKRRMPSSGIVVAHMLRPGIDVYDGFGPQPSEFDIERDPENTNDLTSGRFFWSVTPMVRAVSCCQRGSRRA